MNYSEKIDLLKLKDAFLANMKGRTATKKCVIIPVEDNFIFIGEKGVYLNLTCIELRDKKYQSFVVKLEIPEEIREKMSEDERKAQPIIDGFHSIINDKPSKSKKRQKRNPLLCRLFGHLYEKPVIVIKDGRRNHFYECVRCGRRSYFKRDCELYLINQLFFKNNK